VTDFWLGTMAVAMVVMTIVQLGVVIVAARLAREASETAREVRRELRPLVEKAHRITDDAARATSLALAQVERVDELLTTTTQRVDEVLSVVHAGLIGPMRHGAALVAALRAAFAVFSSRQDRGRSGGRDEEDALFIG
jgi:hypothetical protein